MLLKLIITTEQAIENIKVTTEFNRYIIQSMNSTLNMINKFDGDFFWFLKSSWVHPKQFWTKSINQKTKLLKRLGIYNIPWKNSKTVGQQNLEIA